MSDKVCGNCYYWFCGRSSCPREHGLVFPSFSDSICQNFREIKKVMESIGNTKSDKATFSRWDIMIIE